MPNGTDFSIHNLFWDVIKFFGGLILSLLGYIGIKETRRVSALFRWKDNVVDPALRSFPERYISRDQCDRCHDDLKSISSETLAETKHVRELLERHLWPEGGGG